MTQQEYLGFERNAFQRLVELNEQLRKKYKLSSYERFDYDQRSGDFVFSDRGVAKVIAKLQVVGSVSNKAQTWLWSWANAYVLETACDQICRVREFGKANSIRKLTEPKWTAVEADGWEMAAVSAAIINAKGAYRCPGKSGPLFVVFTDIQFASV
jgi:hypothetical protein